MMNFKLTSCFLLALVTTATSGWAMNLESADAASSMGSVDASASGAFKTGIGLGLAVGYGVSKADIRTTFGARTVPYGIQKIRMNRGSLTGSLVLDYAHFLTNGWFFGGAVAVDIDARALKKKALVSMHPDAAASVTVKRTFALAPQLVFGKKFGNKWLGSLQVGPSFAFFSHSSTYIAETSTKDSDRNSQVGFMVGMKVAYSLSPKIVGFVGVDYAHYGKVKNKYNKPIFLNAAGVPLDRQCHKAEVKYSVFTPKIGVSYRF